MIKDVVVQNGLLGIATGTRVCMVGDSTIGQITVLEEDRRAGLPPGQLKKLK